jgi:mRNA-degrading endonuclease RelE of RelBE toxin-antitoxin system
MQQALVSNPEAGDIIPGSGGVRKLRWSVTGRGKRGGIRVIYYLRSRQGQVWMLT